MTNKELSVFFKALSDETRVQVMKMLSTENLCACQLLKELNISQPTLSHHMRILCESGLVIANKAGKWVHYRINAVMFDQIKTFFDYNEKGNIACDICMEK
ncbi:MAG: metalloregulator ArsR/SmtB family transcription factor [Candidatus Izemoplasmatales bacterium]|jgi:ArsR family transcriptional regulator|nr:metalloregulator ArsR/SmtB family transcription factor [Candidatus Izemoplasmatales bacterium]MDD3864969.1 metalloregulator ArsR/SmtB family transcription factor [Candidatus Izemoplasmatales bacterium]